MRQLVLLLQNVDPTYEPPVEKYIWVGVVFIALVAILFMYQRYQTAKKAAEAKGAARRLDESLARGDGKEPPVSDDGVL